LPCTTANRAGCFGGTNVALRNIIPANRITTDGAAIADVYRQSIALAAAFINSPIGNNVTFQQPNPLAKLHQFIEDTIASSRLDWTFLRPGMFSCNARDWWEAPIRANAPVRWPYLCAPTAPIDERDVAEIGVRALCAPENHTTHSRQEYVLTGPESLTQLEQLNLLGQAPGRPLRVEEISPDEARSELLARFPLPAINMLLNGWDAALGQPALVTSSFAELTGRPPHTFLQWATDNAQHFRAASVAS